MKHREVPPAATPAIPDDNAPVAPARRPTWWTVRTVRALAFVLVGLAVAVSLLSTYISWRTARDSATQAAAVNERLVVLEDDLGERTRQRDAERDAGAARDAATRAEMTALLCELLGQLPADAPNLDRLRETLGCTQPGTAAAGPPAAPGDDAGVDEPRPGSQAGPGALPSPSPDGGASPSAPPSAPPDGLEPSGLVCDLLPLC